MRTVHILFITGLLAATAAGTAAADDSSTPPSQADLGKAKQHYARGAELFETKKYEAAVVEFKESYRLSRNPVLLYNIGYTLDQLGAADKAIFYYQKFLDDTPDDAKNRDLAADRIDVLRRQIGDDALFASAAVQPARPAKQPGAEPTPPPTPPPAPRRKASPDEFKHNVVEAAPPGKPLDITAFVPTDAGWRAVMHYRTGGEPRFHEVEMETRYNELVARIPASRLRESATLQYYVEARNEADQVVARSGESSSPHLIIVEAGAATHFYPDFGDPAPTAAPAAATSGEGGFTDVQSSKFRAVKWGATGAAVGLLALTATFYFVAADASSTIEGDAISSADCSRGPPCKTWDPDDESLQNRGKRFETLANVSLGLGVAAAATAGITWYWEIKQHNKARRQRDVAAVPVIGDGFVGGAAALRF